MSKFVLEVIYFNSLPDYQYNFVNSGAVFYSVLTETDSSCIALLHCVIDMKNSDMHAKTRLDVLFSSAHCKYVSFILCSLISRHAIENSSE